LTRDDEEEKLQHLIGRRRRTPPNYTHLKQREQSLSEIHIFFFSFSPPPPLLVFKSSLVAPFSRGICKIFLIKSAVPRHFSLSAPDPYIVRTTFSSSENMMTTYLDLHLMATRSKPKLTDIIIVSLTRSAELPGPPISSGWTWAVGLSPTLTKSPLY
jgi:hypothetical protein